MPSVMWFSRKNASGSMRSWTRSDRSKTVSRRALSKMLSLGWQAWARVLMDLPYDSACVLIFPGKTTWVSGAATSERLDVFRKASEVY